MKKNIFKSLLAKAKFGAKKGERKPLPSRDNFESSSKWKRFGRKKGEPHRDSVAFPLLNGGASNYRSKQILKPNTFNLRSFSRTPFVRRAINALKNPIKLNPWVIKPMDGIEINTELQRQIDIVTQCFLHPNNDINFLNLIELAIEDWCVLGAVAIEQQVGSDPLRPLWMWPIDVDSLFVFPGWDGSQNTARYFQSIGYGQFGSSPDEGVLLRNDEVVYIPANPANDTPYGYGPVQIAFNSINRQLSTASYAGELAGNSQPRVIVYLGKTDERSIASFRAWWRNDIEGQGMIPFTGGDTKPEAIDLHSGTDDALYLKYQEWLVREISSAFDLSPQNLGIERDVNRSQGEVAEDRDWEQAIKPLAISFQEYFTREILHAKLGWYQLQFEFVGLEREDEKNLAEIYQIEFKNNCITPNEYRLNKGLPPMDGLWGDKTYADMIIAQEAARGAAVVDDPALEQKNESNIKLKQKKSS